MLRREFDQTMGLAGCAAIEHINRDMIVVSDCSDNDSDIRHRQLLAKL